ncbi:MAG: hypothetical protein H6719_36380 [Sandaracinaceae bacterium]|nr:hypothetical protein [Sandaracinaceae bacterium]
MKRLARVLTQLPLATALGAGLGLLVALVAAVLSATPLRLTVHPLAPFALAPLPALLGAWIDWARLWRPSPRTRFWSFALLALSGLGAVEASVWASDVGSMGLLLAPAVPVGAALVVGFGAWAMLFLGRRGVRVAGFELACGTIRKDEVERLVVDTGDGALEVSRALSADLGSRREIDLSTGATIALLARVRDALPSVGPFRTERRAEARTVLAVAGSPRDLSRTVRRRARAWVGYLLLLALGASAFAATAAYQPQTACTARGCLMKQG